MIRYWLVCLPFLCLSLLSAQNRDDCRLDLDNLKPIIERYNPFFGDHKWNAQSRIEMARIDNHRLLVITQDGCLRHHIRFGLLIDASLVKDEPSFWTEEAISMLHKVYFEREEYASFAQGFEEAFKQKISSYGVNQSFNFPVGGRTFICQVINDPTRGARISIEMVIFVFKETVKTQQRGIPTAEDDGWNDNP
ncbi:MAG: hypothetical protein AB8H47_16955 [Bacteroidia bacterium]